MGNEARFCSNCGARQESVFAFCANCGNALSDGPMEQPSANTACVGCGARDASRLFDGSPVFVCDDCRAYAESRIQQQQQVELNQVMATSAEQFMLRYLKRVMNTARLLLILISIVAPALVTFLVVWGHPWLAGAVVVVALYLVWVIVQGIRLRTKLAREIIYRARGGT